MFKWLATKFETCRASLQSRLEDSLKHTVVPTPHVNAAEWRKRGNAFLSAGSLDEAAECYRCGIRVAPNDAACYSNLGFVLGKCADIVCWNTSCRRWIFYGAVCTYSWWSIGLCHRRLPRNQRIREKRKISFFFFCFPINSFTFLLNGSDFFLLSVTPFLGYMVIFWPILNLSLKLFSNK